VHVSGTARTRSALTAADVTRVVQGVLRAEGTRGGSMSVTFLTSQQMRALNRRSFGRDRSTDVIAFPLVHGSEVAGDVYLCPAVARRSAGTLGLPRREEEVRTLVHGVLHALGYAHPSGDDRVRSPMWRRQERYVDRFGTGKAQ
jgi:probable rRNA maturation factor